MRSASADNYDPSRLTTSTFRVPGLKLKPSPRTNEDTSVAPNGESSMTLKVPPLRKLNFNSNNKPSNWNYEYMKIKRDNNGESKSKLNKVIYYIILYSQMMK